MAFKIQPHVRLQEWVAEERGFFTAEGLDYEFAADGFAAGSAATVSSAGTAPLLGAQRRLRGHGGRPHLRRLLRLPLGGERGRQRPAREDVRKGVLGLPVRHLRRRGLRR